MRGSAFQIAGVVITALAAAFYARQWFKNGQLSRGDWIAFVLFLIGLGLSVFLLFAGNG
jgi:hypothetical protein